MKIDRFGKLQKLVNFGYTNRQTNPLNNVLSSSSVDPWPKLAMNKVLLLVVGVVAAAAVIALWAPNAAAVGFGNPVMARAAGGEWRAWWWLLAAAKIELG